MLQRALRAGWLNSFFFLFMGGNHTPVKTNSEMRLCVCLFGGGQRRDIHKLVLPTDAKT